jgi:hypothetical protein
VTTSLICGGVLLPFVGFTVYAILIVSSFGAATIATLQLLRCLAYRKTFGTAARP